MHMQHCTPKTLQTKRQKQLLPSHRLLTSGVTAGVACIAEAAVDGEGGAVCPGETGGGVGVGLGALEAGGTGGTRGGTSLRVVPQIASSPSW